MLYGGVRETAFLRLLCGGCVVGNLRHRLPPCGWSKSYERNAATKRRAEVGKMGIKKIVAFVLVCYALMTLGKMAPKVEINQSAIMEVKK